MVIPRSVFNVIRFDSKVCDDWHLYAVDYSLSVRRVGYKVFVLPLETYHRLQDSPMSGRYYATLKKVLSERRGNFPVI